jgi:hypothetical protein
MVMQAQVIPEPHQRRLAPSRNTWGAGATTTNVLWQLHRNQHKKMLSEPANAQLMQLLPAAASTPAFLASRWARLVWYVAVFGGIMSSAADCCRTWGSAAAYQAGQPTTHCEGPGPLLLSTSSWGQHLQRMKQPTNLRNWPRLSTGSKAKVVNCSAVTMSVLLDGRAYTLFGPWHGLHSLGLLSVPHGTPELPLLEGASRA